MHGCVILSKSIKIYISDKSLDSYLVVVAASVRASQYTYYYYYSKLASFSSFNHVWFIRSHSL